MSTDIFSVDENDSIELVLHIMRWKNIHHMPVINSHKELIGLLTWTDIENYVREKSNHQSAVKDIMRTEIVTINQYQSHFDATQLMKQHNINCLPVVKDNMLIGMVTSNDI